MQLHLHDLVREDTIRVRLEVRTAEHAIRYLAGILEKNGYVAFPFAEDVWQREVKHPTGLPTEPVGVAIPHADAHNILRSAVAIGVLTHAVPFGMMGGERDASVAAQIVFLLAIKESEKQVAMIQELVKLLQSPGLLAELSQAESQAEVSRILIPGQALAKVSMPESRRRAG